MDTSQLPFEVSEPIRELIKQVEQLARTEIRLREGEFNRFDQPASAQGGFDHWMPHVTVNRLRRNEFDEHALAHELLHIKRFLGGAPILETPDALTGINSVDAENRKAFVDDVTNQIEHIAIFPELEKFGFDPHENVERWKAHQIESLRDPHGKQFGPVDRSWLAIKVGLGEFLGRSVEMKAAYREAIRQVAPAAIDEGDEIAGLIRRYGVAKPYNLRRLYEQMLRTAEVPRRALLLKELNFSSKNETLTPFPP